MHAEWRAALVRIKALNLSRPVKVPASPCPRCYAEGVLLPFFNGTDSLPFECACGERWLVDRAVAVKHAVWLDRNRLPWNRGGDQ